MFTVGILTVSDKGSRGERADVSGPTIKDFVTATFDCSVVKYEVIPDEWELIADRLAAWCDEGGVDVILTTGGTGLSARDVTPEATLSVIEKEVPGIPEAIRVTSMARVPTAMLSRAVAGIRKKTLIINMPGSPKAVKEYLEVIVPALPHAVEILKGTFTEHKAT